MKIFIVHGYGATPADHWFFWVSEQLEADGHHVKILALPDPADPIPQAWESTLSQEIGQVDDQTAIVTHSLGTVTTLRWLDSLTRPWKLRGLVMVSGFEGAIPALPELDQYMNCKIDAGFVAKNIDIPVMIHSDNDELVPPQQSKDLAALMDAQVHEVKGAGHFLGSEGHVTLPIVVSAIREIATS